MKVKLRKHKKSPAPVVVEQANEVFLNPVLSYIKEIKEVTSLLDISALLKTDKWICLKILFLKGNNLFILGRVI